LGAPPKIAEEAEITPLKTQEAANEEEYLVETKRHEIVFSNIGGSIKEIRLKDFKSRDGASSLGLAAVTNPHEYILAIGDPINRLQLDTSRYELTREPGVVTYILKTKDADVVKRFFLHNYNDAIELQITISNKTATPQEFVYRITGGSGMSEEAPQDKRFLETAAKIDDKVTGLKTQKGKRTITTGSAAWVALKNKYFSIILKPHVPTKSVFYQNIDENLASGIDIQNFTIPPHSSVEHKYILYAGPADVRRLETLGLQLEESLNYGIFGAISGLLLDVIRFFYKISHSWGIAIILLAVALNLLLFPLTNKSFKSMQKMQALQPEMEALKAKHKDNPQKMNKEVMELYKKYNINPFSGCLPLLLQMPIFIALYNALVRFVEFKNARFLWIKDLSLPDALRLPATLPVVGNSINILPILMAISMIVQQKLSSASAGAVKTAEQKQQQNMMLMMSVVFGFIFYNLPSGLVLYWFMNTLMTIIEQLLLKRRLA
jgi:YidC/Oxa1 family membrane protein insertase